MRIFKSHPLLRLVNSYVIDSPQPSNLSYLWNFGSLLAFCLIIQIVTGVTLAMHYNPSVLEAFNSVEHIMRDVNNGWLIRYLHSNTASAFFFLVYLHIGRNLYYSSYKAPRTLSFALGVVILVVMMATAFLGYVLPYGQMSLWGATVITNLMSAIPWIGQDIVEFIWGGFSVNNATLNRFFALHFVLPFVIAALVLMHLIALHDTAGSSNPLGISGNYDRLAFAPYFIFKDLVTIFLFILVLSIFVFFMPNVLGDSENYVMANPMQTPPAIVPEWYLLPFYAILRSIPNKLLGVIAMFAALVILLTLPFTDLSRTKGAQFKPLSKIIYYVFVANFLMLMVLGAKHVESPFIELGQISTVIYFLYFLFLVPQVTLFENTLTEMPAIKKSSTTAYNVYTPLTAGLGSSYKALRDAQISSSSSSRRRTMSPVRENSPEVKIKREFSPSIESQIKEKLSLNRSDQLNIKKEITVKEETIKKEEIPVYETERAAQIRRNGPNSMYYGYKPIGSVHNGEVITSHRNRIYTGRTLHDLIPTFTEYEPSGTNQWWTKPAFKWRFTHAPVRRVRTPYNDHYIDKLYNPDGSMKRERGGAWRTYRGDLVYPDGRVYRDGFMIRDKFGAIYNPHTGLLVKDYLGIYYNEFTNVHKDRLGFTYDENGMRYNDAKQVCDERGYQIVIKEHVDYDPTNEFADILGRVYTYETLYRQHINLGLVVDADGFMVSDDVVKSYQYVEQPTPQPWLHFDSRGKVIDIDAENKKVQEMMANYRKGIAEEAPYARGYYRDANGLIPGEGQSLWDIFGNMIVSEKGHSYYSWTVEHWKEAAKKLRLDSPRPWGTYFQDSASPQMEGLIELHDNIMFYLVIILFAVGWILISVVRNYSYLYSPISHKYSNHGTLIELIWTITPALILILIAFPSFKLLYLMDEVSDPAMAVLAEGHQWYWSYQYPDFLNTDQEFIEYDSYLVPEPDLEEGALRMLEVDNRVILPELTHVRFIVTAADVIHSYACPALGIKCDAYPGRLSQVSVLINREGVFYGQCSEICGILHSSMPIVIESLPIEKFLSWLEEQ